MARDGFGVYSPPAGTLATPATPIESAKYNAFVNDLTNDANLARPIVAGGTGASTAAGALVNLGIGGAAQLSGRNLIINGQGRVNQRGYTSGTATSVANQYTLDRWRVVVSGQALTFTGDDSKRTMTAPAGGVEQVIRGANVEGGTYVLNWTGTATATVNGVPIAKGGTASGLPANTNVTIRFTSGTFTDVQFEAGTLATVFERRDFDEELARCQPYYETGVILFSGNVTSGSTYLADKSFAVAKRTTSPSIATVNTGLANFPNTISVSPRRDGFSFSAVANGTGAGLLAYTFTASDEL